MNDTLNTCEDCGILCDTSLEDQLAYLNNTRCAECEAKMLNGMQEEQENDKTNFFLETQQTLKERTGEFVPIAAIIRDFAKYYTR